VAHTVTRPEWATGIGLHAIRVYASHAQCDIALRLSPAGRPIVLADYLSSLPFAIGAPAFIEAPPILVRDRLVINWQ
jgi:hypothetical protein